MKHERTRWEVDDGAGLWFFAVITGVHVCMCHHDFMFKLCKLQTRYE